MIYTVTLNPALDRELTVSEINFDTVLRASSAQMHAGGKGFNVSRALAMLDTKSVALGFVGGLTGQRISNQLADLDITTDFVRIEGETRTNVSIVSESEAHHIKVNEAGPMISPKEQKALLDQITEYAKSEEWWVLSGSLPPGIEPSFYAQIIRIVQAAGSYAVVDTSGPALKYACEAGPFLVKPNAVEAGAMLDQPVDSLAEVQAAAQAIQAFGVGNVLISRGADGAFLQSGSQSWQASPPDIQERNPIGAGDASVAGLVYGLSHQLDWPEALRWSMACGAAAASLAGTAMGSLALVSELSDQVKVNPINLG